MTSGRLWSQDAASPFPGCFLLGVGLNVLVDQPLGERQVLGADRDHERAQLGDRLPEQHRYYLRQALPGGPVFADTRWGLYYALVPEGTDRLPSWTHRSEDAECLGPNAYLGVPDPTHTDPGVGFSYWCVPPHAPETLCSPDEVAQLLKDGRCRLTAAEANTGA